MRFTSFGRKVRDMSVAAGFSKLRTRSFRATAVAALLSVMYFGKNNGQKLNVGSTVKLILNARRINISCLYASHGF